MAARSLLPLAVASVILSLGADFGVSMSSRHPSNET